MNSQLNEDDLTEDVFARHQPAHSSKFSPRKWAASVGMSPVKRKMGRGSTHQDVEESSIDIYGDLSMDTIVHVEADENDNSQMVGITSNDNSQMVGIASNDNSQMVGIASNATANVDLFTDNIVTDRSEKEELENRIKELEEINKQLVSDNVFLQKSKDQVSKNISALFLTARLEIGEKDKEIEELRQEIEHLKTAQAQHVCHVTPPPAGQETTPGASDSHRFGMPSASDSQRFGTGPEAFGHPGQETTASSLQTTETYSPFELFKKGLGKRGGREKDGGSPKRYSDKPPGKARDRPPTERGERSDSRGERPPTAGFDKDSRSKPFRQREMPAIDSRRELKRKPERDAGREKYPAEAGSSRDRCRSPVRSRRGSWARNPDRERSRSPAVSPSRDSEGQPGKGKGKGKSRVKSRRDCESQSGSDRGRSPGRERKDATSPQHTEVTEEISRVAAVLLSLPSCPDRGARRNRRSSYQDNCEANGDGMTGTQAKVYNDRERRIAEQPQTREMASESVGENDLRAKLSRKRRLEAEGSKGKEGMAPSERVSVGRVEGGQVRKHQLPNGKMNSKSRLDTSSPNNNNNNINNNDNGIHDRLVNNGSGKGKKDLKRVSQKDGGLVVDLCGRDNSHTDTDCRERGENGSGQFFFLPDRGKVKVRKKKTTSLAEENETETTVETPDGTSLLNPFNVNEEEVRSRQKETCEAETDYLNNEEVRRRRKKTCEAGTGYLNDSDLVKEVGDIEVPTFSSSTQETSKASQKSLLSCDSQPQEMMTTTNFPSSTGQQSDVKQPASDNAPDPFSEDAPHASAISEDAPFRAEKNATVSTFSCTSISPHSRIQTEHIQAERIQAEDCFLSYKKNESHKITRHNVGQESSDRPTLQENDSSITPRSPLDRPLTSPTPSSQDFNSLASNASLPFSHLMENTNNSCSQKGEEEEEEERLPQNPPTSPPVSPSNHTWPFKPANSSEGVARTKTTKPPLSFRSSSSTSTSSSSSSSSSSSERCNASGACKNKAKPAEPSVSLKVSSHSEGARAFPITELQQSASDQPSSFPSPITITLTTPSSPTAVHDGTKSDVVLKTDVVCVESVVEKTGNSLEGTVNSTRGASSLEAGSRLGNDTDTNASMMDVNSSCQGSDSYQILVGPPGRDLTDEANLTPPKIRRKKKLSGTTGHPSSSMLLNNNPSPFSPVSRKSAAVAVNNNVVMCTPNLIVLGEEETSSGGATLVSPCKPHHVPTDLYPPGVRMNLQQGNTHRHIRGEPELLHPASDGTTINVFVTDRQHSNSAAMIGGKGKAATGNFDFLHRRAPRSALFTGKRDSSSISSDGVNGLGELSGVTSNETVETLLGEKKSGPGRDDGEKVLREETSSQPCQSEGRSKEREVSAPDVIRMESDESMLSVVREAFVKVFRKKLSTFKSDMAEKAAADHRVLKTTLQKSVGNLLRCKSPLARGRGRKARVRTSSNGSDERKTAKPQIVQDAKNIPPAGREPSYSRTAKAQKKSHKTSSKILGESGEHVAQTSTVVDVSNQERGCLSDMVAVDRVPPCSKCLASLSSCTCGNACLESKSSLQKTTANRPFASPQKSLSGDSQGAQLKSRGVFRFYLFPGVGGGKAGQQRSSSERRSDLGDNNSSSSAAAAVPAEMPQNKNRRNSEDRLIADIVSSLDTDWLEAIEQDFSGKMEVNPRLCQTDPLQEGPGPRGGTHSGEISFAGRIPSSLNSEGTIISEDNVVVRGDRNPGSVVESRVYPPPPSATNDGSESDEVRKRQSSSLPPLCEKRLLYHGPSLEAACCVSPDVCLVTSSDLIGENGHEARLGSTRFSPFGVCTEEPDSTSEPFPQQYSTKILRPSPRSRDVGSREAEIVHDSERRATSRPPDELVRASECEGERSRHDLPNSPQRERGLRHDAEILDTSKSSKRKTFRRRSSIGPPSRSRASLKYCLFPRNERDDETSETFDKSSNSDEKSAYDSERATHSLLINSTQNSNSNNSDRNFSQLLRGNDNESPYPVPEAGTSYATKDRMNTTFTVNTASSSDEEEDKTLLASPAKNVREVHPRRSSSFTSPGLREAFSPPSPATVRRRVMPPLPMAMDELSLDARSLSEFDHDLFSRTRQPALLRTSSRTGSFSSLISVGHDSPMSVSSHRFSTPASHRSPRDALLSPPDFKALDSCDEGHGEAFEGVADDPKGCQSQSRQRDPEHCSIDPTVSGSPTTQPKKLSRHLSFHELRLLMLVKSKASVIREEEEEEEDSDSRSENDELSTPTPSSQSAHSLSSYNQAKQLPLREGHEEGGEESGSNEESGQLSDNQSCTMKSQRASKKHSSSNGRAVGRSGSDVNNSDDLESLYHQESENTPSRSDICVPSRGDSVLLLPEASSSNWRDQPAHSPPLSQKETGEDSRSQDATPFEPRQTPRKSVRIAQLLPLENISAGSPPLTSTTEENNFILKRLNPSPLNSCQKTKQSSSSRDRPSMSGDRHNGEKNSKVAKIKPRESCVPTDGGSTRNRKDTSSGGQRKTAKGSVDVDPEVLSWALAHRKNVDKVKVKLDARLDESKPHSKISVNETVCSTNIGRANNDTRVDAEKLKSESESNNNGFQRGNSSKVDKCSDKVVEPTVIMDENENDDDFEDGEIFDDTDGEDGCSGNSVESFDDLSSRIGLENVKPENENRSHGRPQTQVTRNPSSSNADKLNKGRPNYSESSCPNPRDKAPPMSKPEKGKMPSRRSKNFSTKSNPNSGHSTSVVDMAHRPCDHHRHPASSQSQRSGCRREFGGGKGRGRKRQRSPSSNGRSGSRPQPGRSKVVRRGSVGERYFRRSFSAEREDDVDRKGGGGVDGKRGSEVTNLSSRDSYAVADVRRRGGYDDDSGGSRISGDRKSNARHRPDHSTKESTQESWRWCVQSGGRGDDGNCRRSSPLRSRSRRSRSGSSTGREEGCQSRRDWP